MRQIGVLEKAADANRFAAYLVTEGVAAHAEENDSGWTIWVRDENHVDQAKEAYEEFRHHPESPIYQGVERTADTLLRERAREREKAKKNVVEMRGNWRGGAGRGRRAPLVFTLIGLSVLFTLWTKFGSQKPVDELKFVDISRLVEDDSVAARFQDIAQGDVWRLITPIFLHGNAMHLAFNMYLLYIFGAQIEDRMGTWKLGLLALAIAVLSNAAQAAIESANFLGMSGVVFGLFGYVWMKTMYAPESGLYVSRGNAIFLIAWFFICVTGVVGPVANMAHGAGLATGVLIGYFPTIWKSS